MQTIRGLALMLLLSGQIAQSMFSCFDDNGELVDCTPRPTPSPTPRPAPTPEPTLEDISLREWCERKARQMRAPFTVVRELEGVPAGCIRYPIGDHAGDGVAFVETCTGHPNCGTKECLTSSGLDCNVLERHNCAGFIDNVQDTCVDKMTGDRWLWELNGCAFHVETRGTCDDWCRSQGSTCINSSDGVSSTGCEIKNPFNYRRCTEVFNTQICLCKPRPPTPEPTPELTPSESGYSFTLFGTTGEERVLVNGIEHALTTDGMPFHSMEREVTVEFLNDRGARDVQFRSDARHHITAPERMEGWDCETNPRCDSVRQGRFNWNGIYYIHFIDALENSGEDCWSHCTERGVLERGGACDWCGIGNLCCRKGWTIDSSECQGVEFPHGNFHTCVEPVGVVDSGSVRRRLRGDNQPGAPSLPKDGADYN